MWLFTIVVGYFFPYAKKWWGLGTCFIIFTWFTIIGLLFTIFLIKETKGKS